MLPTIAIVGRANVGKSTLFNYLTQSRAALVADLPGLTRDRQYGETKIADRAILLVDTGGVVDTDDTEIAGLTEVQVHQAIEESHCVLFLVDAKTGLVAADEVIAQRLRVLNKKVLLVINKADRLASELVESDFYRLGLGKPYTIAAKSGRGIQTLMLDTLSFLPEYEAPQSTESEIKIAVVGRPNVGKSTLINRFLGEERLIVKDFPGTTRDSIYIPFERDGHYYTLIDTAGVRRRNKVHQAVEKFSMIKSMQAVHGADVVIFVLNAREGINEQDLRLLRLIIEAGTCVVIAINKWDGLEKIKREQLQDDIERRMDFVSFARRYFISALHGTGIYKLLRAVHEAHDSLRQDLSTAALTKVLEKAISDHEPPLVRGRRIRLRYAHLGGRHPLTIIVHGKQTDSLPPSYARYLSNYFQRTFQFVGVPVHIKLVTDKNPYKK